jgi:hypothetical protein
VCRHVEACLLPHAKHVRVVALKLDFKYESLEILSRSQLTVQTNMLEYMYAIRVFEERNVVHAI